jgi:type IV fimbrial biogenesis protein FimT
VFHDANNNAALDVGEAVLLHQQAMPPSILFTGNLPVASYVSYTPTGSASYTSGAFQAGRFTACPQSATPVDARQIVLNSAGRPRTVRTTVNSCT